MNNTLDPYCKHCQFYHGSNKVVCALHPYGPDSKTCSDYAPKTKGLDYREISKDWDTRHHDWEWQKLLILGLLWGALGFGFMLGWLATHPTEPTTDTPSTSEWSR